MIEIPRTIMVVRAVFMKITNVFPQIFLDECLYKL